MINIETYVYMCNIIDIGLREDLVLLFLARRSQSNRISITTIVAQKKKRQKVFPGCELDDLYSAYIYLIFPGFPLFYDLELLYSD